MNKRDIGQRIWLRIALISTLGVLTLSSLIRPDRLAFACECPYISPAESFKSASAVFAGKVVSHEPGDPFSYTDSLGLHTGKYPPTKYTFEVSRVWKGAVTNSTKVDTDNSSCGYFFSDGNTYLVYAVPSWQDSDHLYTEQCSGTIDLNHADSYLEFLGEGYPPVVVNEPSTLPDVPQISGYWIVAPALLIIAISALIIWQIRRRVKTK